MMATQPATTALTFIGAQSLTTAREVQGGISAVSSLKLPYKTVYLCNIRCVKVVYIHAGYSRLVLSRTGCRAAGPSRENRAELRPGRPAQGGPDWQAVPHRARASGSADRASRGGARDRDR